MIALVFSLPAWALLRAAWAMLLRRSLLTLSFLVLGSGLARADELSTTIAKHRITLSDIITEVPAALSEVDLGPAAPPGRSRYVSKKEITLKLRTAGIAASTLSLPPGVRVVSEARQYSADELLDMAKSPIEAALPAGVRLVSARVFQPKLLSPTVSVGSVHLPRFSMKPGTQRQTVTIEILWGDQVFLRLPVQVEVELDESILSQVVKRGTSVTLSIRKGPVEITTLASTLSEGRIGETISVRVPVTKKVVNALIVSSDRVELQI